MPSERASANCGTRASPAYEVIRLITTPCQRQSEPTIKKRRNISAQGPRSHTVHIPELAFSHHPRVRFQIPLPVGVLEMQKERQPVLGNRVGVVVGVEVGLV